METSGLTQPNSWKEGKFTHLNKYCLYINPLYCFNRSDNCIKNYYYSTLRKHIRRINKSLKQCQVAKHLNLKVKTLTADILFPLVKEGKIQYRQIKILDPKKFEDLEHTMRMIFNHEDGQQVTQRGIIAAAQNRLKVEKQLQEMRDREL